MDLRILEKIFYRIVKDSEVRIRNSSPFLTGVLFILDRCVFKSKLIFLKKNKISV